MLPQPFSNLIAQFSKLPGIGPKMAERLTLYLFKQNTAQRTIFSQALTNLSTLGQCKKCFNISDNEYCAICRDRQRDTHILCVVEEPLDIIPIERTQTFDGLYHVLGGTLKHGVKENENASLTITQLVERVRKDDITEVILALNLTAEGDATILQLKQQLSPLDVRITRLARGLATGSDIEHADGRTLYSALTNREEF